MLTSKACVLRVEGLGWFGEEQPRGGTCPKTLDGDPSRLCLLWWPV